MCTVTYLPLGNKNYIITSNRDESTLRKKATPPRKFSISNHAVFYPKDLQAGGTWIATSPFIPEQDKGFTLCLLNGAFQKHRHNPPYKLSRGLMVLDFFKMNDVEQFVNEYNFEGIEPFTLVIIESGSTIKLHELRWDENKIEYAELDETQPNIWNSVTLYDKNIIAQRQQWFSQWLFENNKAELESIMHFHEFGGNGDKRNDLLMNRDNKLMTVSITSVKKSEDGTIIKYKDIAENKLYNIRIM